MENKPIHVKPAMYTLFYENLKVIAREYGYNLVLHGSLNRDMDLIAIPWVDEPRSEKLLVHAFKKYLTGDIIDRFGGYETEEQDFTFSILPGGRHNYVINLNRCNKQGEWVPYGDEQYYLDISFTPLSNMENSIDNKNLFEDHLNNERKINNK